MTHHVFQKNNKNKYSVAILIKESAFNTDNLLTHYVQPLSKLGVHTDRIICFSLEYNTHNKAPVKLIKDYLKNLLLDLDTVGAKNILVADPNYFKVLTGERKSEPHHGYIKKCAIKGYEHLNIILSINYQALFHNPTIQDRLDLSLKTFANQISGTHIDIGSHVIHYANYPTELCNIKEALNKLHSYPELSVDIETFSLQFWKAGIGTIAFAWDKHNGIAFPCDWTPIPDNLQMGNSLGKIYATQENNVSVKLLLKEFFINYKGKLTYHNATFDIQIIIYELFMADMLDYGGMLNGLNIMCKNIDDTKLIAYLATNTTAGNKLSLKQLAFEHAGNYAQDDIKNILAIPQIDLLRYNLIDCLCTNYVKEKYYPIMLKDNQLGLYNNLFIPGTKTILHIQLTGMPINMHRVNNAEVQLKTIRIKYEKFLSSSKIIKAHEWETQRIAMITANLILKKKVKPIDDFYEKFNPASNLQVRELLYRHLKYEVIDKTDTGLPATGAKTLKKLLVKLESQDKTKSEYAEEAKILEALIEIAGVSKILSTFISAFKINSVVKSDGNFYLHGNFNLTGTQSMRLSSNSPNLQNLPANSTYGKLIKECFIGSDDWLFGGADFNALEAVADALVTKDPNKIVILADGLDSHSWNAFHYFKDQMPDIVKELEGYFD